MIKVAHSEKGWREREREREKKEKNLKARSLGSTEPSSEELRGLYKYRERQREKRKREREANEGNFFLSRSISCRVY